MIEEGQCSDFQQLTPQQNFISRQNYFREGKNISNNIQKSVWSLQKFINRQAKKSSSSRPEEMAYINFILRILDQITKTFEKEFSLNLFLKQLKTIIDHHLQTNNSIFVENSYVFFCNVFLQQCIFFILSLLNSFSLADLKKQLLTRRSSVAICIKKAQNKQEFIFTLRLGNKQGEEDTSSTLNSKEKVEQQDNKNAQNQKQVDQNQSDPQSLIEPPVSQKPQQKQKQSEQDFLMEYFKKLFSTTSFIILVSKKPHIYLFNKTEKLGQGGFGSVFKSEQLKLVNGHSSQSTWAIKELKKNIQIGNTIGQDRQHQMLSSISKLSGMKMRCSKNIIEVQEVINFDNKKYIVYEFCPAKDLRRFIKNNDSQFNKKHIFMIIQQLAATLILLHYQLITNQTDMEILDAITADGEIETDNKKYFKERMYINSQVGIIHRDLKPTNILVSYFSETHIKIKLIDWAFSKRTFTEDKICGVYCGTINYQAPEILNKKLYCCKVDVWAFGVIVYELLTGRQFMQKEDKDKMKKDDEFVRNKLRKMQLRNDKKFSQPEVAFWKSLISKCLQFIPQNRFSSRQALENIRNRGLYKPITKQAIMYIQQLKMTRAQYFYHHNNILQLAPSDIRSKILIKISVHVENALEVIYQKFTQDKYWNSEKPQITWEVQKKFGRYKEKQCKKETFEQCMQMLQNYPCKKYPQYKAFKQLVEKVKKRYFQLS